MSTPSPDQPPPRLLHALSSSRYLIIIAVLSTLVAATALLAYGAYETFAVLRGVWLHDGPSSSGSPVWLDGRLLAFTRRDEDGGTSVRVRRLGFGAVGASCTRGDDCLTSRCERGECIE